MNLTAPAFQQQTAEEYDRIVRADIELFRQQSEDYLTGRINDDEFRAFRLRRGIYGQRQEKVHMVRTKVPGGILTAGQLDTLANVADEYGSGRGHLTTRQTCSITSCRCARSPVFSTCLPTPG